MRFADGGHVARPYISVLFECCQVYLRIYRHHSGDFYAGRCPRCGKPVKFVVGSGGSTTRMWRVK